MCKGLKYMLAHYALPGAQSYGDLGVMAMAHGKEETCLLLMTHLNCREPENAEVYALLAVASHLFFDPSSHAVAADKEPLRRVVADACAHLNHRLVANARKLGRAPHVPFREVRPHHLLQGVFEDEGVVPQGGRDIVIIATSDPCSRAIEGPRGPPRASGGIATL